MELLAIEDSITRNMYLATKNLLENSHWKSNQLVALGINASTLMIGYHRALTPCLRHDGLDVVNTNCIAH